MKHLRRIWLRFVGLFSSSTSEADLDREINSHLVLLEDEYLRQGLTPQQARTAARRSYGGIEQAKQLHRNERSYQGIAQALQDARYAMRRLRKSPGFTVTAVLTLALGIGAATAIFSVVDSVLLEPLAYRNSGQLVVAWERVRFIERLFPYIGPNPRHAQIWSNQATDFSGLTLIQPDTVGVSLGKSDHPRYVGMVSAQANLLDVLNVQPAIGRNFLPAEAQKGRNNVALISWELWQSFFQGDTSAIGKSVWLNGTPLQVIGVLPKRFYFPKANELSPIPRAMDLPALGIISLLTKEQLADVSLNGDYGNYIALGRLKPGVTVAHATSQLNAITRGITRLILPNQRGDDKDVETSLAVYVQPLKEAIVGRTTHSLWLLFGAVLSVLLIACVNLANAQLARSAARDRESAIRSALGASAWSLLQAALAEVAILSVTGGALGIALAYLAVKKLPAFTHLAFARTEDLSLNPTVLGLSIVLTVGATLLFGLLPSLRLFRIKPQQALQDNYRSAGSRRGTTLRRWLVGLQVFACTVLLLLAGFLSKSLVALLNSDKGFSSDHILSAAVDLSGDAFSNAERVSLDDAVLERLRALPGVQSAAVSNSMLLNGESHIDGLGQPHGPRVLTNYRAISPGYFATLQQRLVQGRELNENDRTHNSIVLTQATAKAIFGNGEALLRQVDNEGVTYTVVGIVADAHSTSLRAAAPVNMAYVGYWEKPPRASFFFIRSTQSASSFSGEVRNAIWSYDPSVTIANVRSLDSQIDDALSAERMSTAILAAFGGSALLLAVLGIYGTLSYSVEIRRREIGVRMALGASRQNVYGITLKEMIAPLCLGLISGWLASLVVGRSIASLLYNTSPMNLPIALGVISIFALAAVSATLVPCFRASRIEPMEALRAE